MSWPWAFVATSARRNIARQPIMHIGLALERTLWVDAPQSSSPTVQLKPKDEQHRTRLNPLEFGCRLNEPLIPCTALTCENGDVLLSAGSERHRRRINATSATVAPPFEKPVEVLTKSAPAFFAAWQALTFSSSLSRAVSIITLQIASYS